MKVLTGTERLSLFLKSKIEEKLKPEGMTSELFWEIYELLSDDGRCWNGANSAVC